MKGQRYQQGAKSLKDLLSTRGVDIHALQALPQRVSSDRIASKLDGVGVVGVVAPNITQGLGLLSAFGEAHHFWERLTRPRLWVAQQFFLAEIVLAHQHEHV